MIASILDLNIYTQLVFNLIAVYYFYTYYNKNKNTILDIRFGKALFFMSSLLILLLCNTLTLSSVPTGITYILLISVCLIGGWFNYEIYKRKNSVLDHIYLIITSSLYLYILYLVW